MRALEVAVIDDFLKPAPVASLVRLGREHDGGYLVDERAIVAADFLLSLGINDDWSFESDFRERNRVPLCAVDGTVGVRKFSKEIIKALPRLDNPRLVLDRVRTLLDYRRFFSGSARHVEALVGIDREPRFLSFASLFRSCVPSDASNVFLKIDIEGWEYRILDELAAVADRVCGMVIEFHDYDLHEQRVREFLRRMPLEVCHVHCNNYQPLTAQATPLVIEVSLTRFGVDRGAGVELPNALDMPNNRFIDDYAIRFR